MTVKAAPPSSPSRSPLPAANDAPEILGIVDNDGLVTETVRRRPRAENAFLHQDRLASLNFSDDDIADTHIVTYMDNGLGYLGTFTTFVDSRTIQATDQCFE